MDVKTQAALVESAPVIIAFHDTEHRILWANAAYRAATGRSLAEIEGRKCYSVWNLATTCRGCPVTTAMKTGEPAEAELTPENQDHWPESQGSWSSKAAPIRDDNGVIIGVVEVAYNINARKQAEKALLTANHQLEVQNRQLETIEKQLESRNIDLERSNKELQLFAYVASHDLQEPLRKVASFTQMLAERYADKLDADAKEFIAYAVDGAHRMQGLINDLLAYSRVGTSGKPFTPVDCETAFEDALANLELTIKDSGAVVSHEPLPTVLGDATQLVQLFQNLIGNAIKFRRPGVTSEVHVSAKRVSGQSSSVSASNAQCPMPNFWLFSVHDNGIGIDPEYFRRIFVIFQRLHSRAEYPGTGIGLAISQKVVERHGGRIWVESEPGKGTTFHFSIPERPVMEPLPMEGITP